MQGRLKGLKIPALLRLKFVVGRRRFVHLFFGVLVPAIDYERFPLDS